MIAKILTHKNEYRSIYYDPKTDQFYLYIGNNKLSYIFTTIEYKDDCITPIHEFAKKDKEIRFEYIGESPKIDMACPRRSPEECPFDYYFYEDLLMIMDENEIKEFNKWYVGQTCGSVNGHMAMYAHDVHRFLELIRHGTPTYFD